MQRLIINWAKIYTKLGIRITRKEVSNVKSLNKGDLHT